jgi:Protein of unknown function (DUF3039)
VIPERATARLRPPNREAREPGTGPTLGFVDEATQPPGPGDAGGTTLAPARPAPDLDEGDHERMAHIVLEGYTPKDGEFVSTGPSVVEGMVNRTPVRALCGKEWVPGRDPARYGLCPTCKEIAESMGWRIPAG